MASTVIRVKRRITDEPFDTFIFNCKRFKSSNSSENNQNGANTDDTNQPIKNKILKLAATVSTEDDIKTHLIKLRKNEAEDIVQNVPKPDRIINKLRDQFKSNAQNQRFKVVSCFRSDFGIDSNESADGSKQNITIVDVIKEEQPNIQTKQNETEPTTTNASEQHDENFVYDLYHVPEKIEPVEEDDFQYISITPFNNFTYQNDDKYADTDYDSEDSNNEAHWRNEYPDTDDGLSVDEEDMRRAVEDLNLDSDANNLSSDDDCNYGEDPVVHFMDESDEDEYEYFKKHGRRKNHGAFYRSNQRNKCKNVDEESDIDDDDLSSEHTDTSGSSVSPLVTCDEDSD